MSINPFSCNLSQPDISPFSVSQQRGRHFHFGVSQWWMMFWRDATKCQITLERYANALRTRYGKEKLGQPNFRASTSAAQPSSPPTWHDIWYMNEEWHVSFLWGHQHLRRRDSERSEARLEFPINDLRFFACMKCEFRWDETFYGGHTQFYTASDIKKKALDAYHRASMAVSPVWWEPHWQTN